jgi:hypothetical protein
MPSTAHLVAEQVTLAHARHRAKVPTRGKHQQTRTRIMKRVVCTANCPFEQDIGQVAAHMWRSDPQMAVDVTLMIASPCSGRTSKWPAADRRVDMHCVIAR